jgi:hypothetical protein
MLEVLFSKKSQTAKVSSWRSMMTIARVRVAFVAFRKALDESPGEAGLARPRRDH